MKPVNTLRIISAVILLPILVGCSVIDGSGGSGPTGGDGLDGSWSLVGAGTAGTDGLTDPSSAPVTLEIAATSASGSAGVNRYMSTITATAEGALAFGPIGSTMMAGPPTAMKAEQAYLATLEIVTGYRVTGTELALYSQDAEILRYLRQ
ncbi:MAG: META domain-containing protein [Candidatus Nanopelagicales bacterium]|jgi:heat shock protein HslJ